MSFDHQSPQASVPPPAAPMIPRANLWGVAGLILALLALGLCFVNAAGGVRGASGPVWIASSLAAVVLGAVGTTSARNHNATNKRMATAAWAVGLVMCAVIVLSFSVPGIMDVFDW